MWYAFLNRMGPCNSKWIDENGRDWAGGRVDLDCDNEKDPNYDRYGVEYSAPVMREKDWYELGEWLGNQAWKDMPSREQVFRGFELAVGRSIEYFRTDDEL